MREQLSNLLSQLQSLQFREKWKAKKVNAICEELTQILNTLETNELKVPSDLFRRMVNVSLELAEVGLLKEINSNPATVSDQPEKLNSLQLKQDLLEWAKGQFSEEEIIAGIQEIQETGGLELRDFIAELEELVTPNDRINK